MEETTPYYNRITVISDERVDLVELAKAVKKFGVVSSVSSSQQRSWDE